MDKYFEYSDLLLDIYFQNGKVLFYFKQIFILFVNLQNCKTFTGEQKL